MEYKLALVARTDLGMGRGKIAAQAAHAAVAGVLRADGTADLGGWRDDGQPKVVLRAGGEDELRELGDAARAAGLAVEVIHAAGRTQVVAGVATCLAIGPAPADKVDAVTGELPLL